MYSRDRLSIYWIVVENHRSSLILYFSSKIKSTRQSTAMPMRQSSQAACLICCARRKFSICSQIPMKSMRCRSFLSCFLILKTPYVSFQPERRLADQLPSSSAAPHHSQSLLRVLCRIKSKHLHQGSFQRWSQALVFYWYVNCSTNSSSKKR